jgi:hypothetical protein
MKLDDTFEYSFLQFDPASVVESPMLPGTPQTTSYNFLLRKLFFVWSRRPGFLKIYAEHRWLTPVILATQELEIGSIAVRS